MHYSMAKTTGGSVFHMRHTTGGSVMLLGKIKIARKSNDIMGGDLGANRTVGIISNPMPAPPSNSIASAYVGGSLDFSKHVRSSARNIQKRNEKDSNINFVY